MHDRTLLGAMHLNSDADLTGLIRELKVIGNSTSVWWRISVCDSFSRNEYQYSRMTGWVRKREKS
jgi:hypothetical protein